MPPRQTMPDCRGERSWQKRRYPDSLQCIFRWGAEPLHRVLVVIPLEDVCLACLFPDATGSWPLSIRNAARPLDGLYGSGYLVVGTRVRGFYHGRKGKLFSIGMCVHSWNGYSLGYSLCAVRLIVVH